MVTWQHNKHTSQILLREHGADAVSEAQVIGESYSPVRAETYLSDHPACRLSLFVVNNF